MLPQTPLTAAMAGGYTGAGGMVSTGPTMAPSTCVVVKNMFDPKTEKDVDFDLDIKEDVEEECQKHGSLKHLFVDKVTAGGHVYIRFHDKSTAEKVVRAFAGRWYAQRQVSADFV